MRAVVDTSVTVNALVDAGPAGNAARAAFRELTLFAPSGYELEALSALRGLHVGQAAGRQVLDRAAQDLTSLGVRSVPVARLVARIWDLRDNLTAYDAAFVALAEALGAPLVTADRRLTNASGPRCEFLLAPARG